MSRAARVRAQREGLRPLLPRTASSSPRGEGWAGGGGRGGGGAWEATGLRVGGSGE